MSTAQDSPRVGEHSGSDEVDTLGVFKDVKLWPGGGREWDWGETNTRARTFGIQPSDVRSCWYTVLTSSSSVGRELRLQTQAETFALLADQVSTWSSTRRRRPLRLTTVSPQRVVGGVLIHSTC